MLKFDIQLFADTVTSEQELQIKANFGEDDNRTINVPQARSDIESSEITELETWVKANNVLVGDKEGAAFTDFESAILQMTTRNKLDLTSLT